MKRTVHGKKTTFAITKAAVVALMAWAAGAAWGGATKPAAKPGAAPPQGGYTVQAVQGGGTISGKVLYQGKPIKPRRVAVTQDNSVCGNMKEMYPVRIEGGGVVDAVVSIEGIDHGKAWDLPPAVLDQKGCMFVPPVVVMQPGELKVENSDSVAHNVHVYSNNNRSFNQVMPPGSAALEVPMYRPDTAIVRCDVHSWMQGHIIVAANPYYVLSGAGGSFTIADVPPGTYHVKVWQADLGTKDQTVTVQAGQTATANFTFTK